MRKIITILRYFISTFYIGLRSGYRLIKEYNEMIKTNKIMPVSLESDNYIKGLNNQRKKDVKDCYNIIVSTPYSARKVVDIYVFFGRDISATRNCVNLMHQTNRSFHEVRDIIELEIIQ